MTKSFTWHPMASPFSSNLQMNYPQAKHYHPLRALQRRRPAGADHFITREISVGDFVLSGGELAAAVLCDSIIRLLPGCSMTKPVPLTDSFFRTIYWPCPFIPDLPTTKVGRSQKYCWVEIPKNRSLWNWGLKAHPKKGVPTFWINNPLSVFSKFLWRMLVEKLHYR